MNLTTPIHDLLDELHRLDIRAEAHGDRLHIDAPAGAITPTMANRLKAHKVELLEALNTPTDTPTPNPILSAAGIAPGDLPLVDDFRAAFPNAQVIEVVTEGENGNVAPPIEQAEAIIQAARDRGDEQHAQDLQDAWDERLAVCTIHGGLDQDHAGVVALNELREAA